MKLLISMLAGSLFSASFAVPKYGFVLATLAALCILVFHVIP